MMLLLRSQLKVTFIIKCSRLLSRGSSQAGSRTSGPGLSPLDEGLRGHLGRQVPDPGPSHDSPWSCRAATRHRADLTRASTLCLRPSGPRLSVEISRGFLSSQKLQSTAPFDSFLFYSRRFQRLPHVYPPVPADDPRRVRTSSLSRRVANSGLPHHTTRGNGSHRVRQPFFSPSSI